jgi:membrane protein implicated in regulation of membrane protease activity
MSLGNGAGAEGDAPPAGEEIHLPGPTLLPLFCAIGLTLMVIGTTLGFIFSIIGVVILVIAVTRWIRETRRNVEALPEEHR